MIAVGVSRKVEVDFFQLVCILGSANVELDVMSRQSQVVKVANWGVAVKMVEAQRG